MAFLALAFQDGLGQFLGYVEFVLADQGGSPHLPCGVVDGYVGKGVFFPKHGLAHTLNQCGSGAAYQYCANQLVLWTVHWPGDIQVISSWHFDQISVFISYRI